MKYSYFENQGFPIGSGVLEGACKHVVQIRMKRNGMIWSISGANEVLQLRCLQLSNRWEEVKNVIEKKRVHEINYQQIKFTPNDADDFFKNF